MTKFEKQLHDMFDHIWDCEIDHPVFQDTVGDLMSAVIQAHYNSVQPDNRLTEIADLVEGTIDHFNLEDAMDLLYQIKDVLK